MSKIAAVILAAGASTRLGSPKQLLSYKGTTLIEHSIDVALKSGCFPVIVVLGAYKEKIQPLIEKYSVEVVENELWSQGMGSSIKAGIKALSDSKDIKACLIMLCDQPLVSVISNKRIIGAYLSGKSSIITSLYENSLGVPALFDKSYFNELVSLKDNEGAKKLFAKYKTALEQIDFPEGAIDIDTVEDYKKLK